MKIIFFLVIILSTVSGAILFYTKHEVLLLEKNLKTVEANIDQTKKELSILHAGWAYLTNPKRIDRLSQKYLSNYKTVSHNQIHHKDDKENSNNKTNNNPDIKKE